MSERGVAAAAYDYGGFKEARPPLKQLPCAVAAHGCPGDEEPAPINALRVRSEHRIEECTGEA